MERTLILVKPDAFARNLTGEIIARFERKGLRLAALKLMTMTRELAERHYAEHDGKPFFGELVEFITSGPLVAMVLEGESAVEAARQVIGATNPLEAAPARSAATTRSRSARTWSTAPTRPSRRRARRAVLPRAVLNLILASGSPQRRAILEQLGVEFEVVVSEVEELTAGPAARGRGRERLPEGVDGGHRPAGGGGARRRHGRRARRADLRQAAPTRRGRATLRALAGAGTWWSAASA